MTRRIIKDENGLYADIRCMQFSHINDKWQAVMRSAIGFATLQPAYHLGEVVAVAQSYKDAGLDEKKCDCFQLVVYGDFPPRHHHGWTNKMFVAADLMPHQIRITNIRVERLQGISEDDCLFEGIYQSPCPPELYGFKVNRTWRSFTDARKAFAALIDKVSGRGTWESNPWVFVYEFERVK